jgi:hypothetical protein
MSVIVVSSAQAAAVVEDFAPDWQNCTARTMFW